MKLYFLLPSIALLNLSLMSFATAQTNPVDVESDRKLLIQKLKSATNPPEQKIVELSEVTFPSTNAELLVQQPDVTDELKSEETADPTDELETDETADPNEILVEVEGQQDTFTPTSSPVYQITEEDLIQQNPNSLSEALRGLPGFAINDFGFGADIHTGTYFRGNSINQTVYLLNGRPINTNINTYHGATDLNSIPVGAIERVELSSGTSSTLYGSEAFGGVINIITKQGQQTPTFNGSAEFGEFEQSQYRASYGGSINSVRFNVGYEEYSAENRYRVPEGSVNRDAEGFLFNGDTATSNYFGSIGVDVNSRNTLSLDAYKISSRRGLLYFGFPLQRDRLDHDVFNVGLSWRTLLGNSDDSVLNTTIAYNQDYFNTYGPTQNIFFRTGTLNSQAVTARVDHDWQLTSTNTLRWGIDLQSNDLNGDVLSTAPNRTALNQSETRDRFHTALFALNSWKITDTFGADLGLRQNFSSEFGSYLNPSVGLRWAASQNIALRGSWVGVQRNPGLDQLYVYDTVHNWLPNPDLDPETGSSWTAGVDVQLSRSLTGQFTYFGSSLSDRLGIINGQWANIGLVKTNGLEAALKWQINPRWSTFLNYTYTDAKIKSGVEEGLQLGLLPYSVAQLGVGYGSGDWQVNLYASYFGGARRAFFNNPGESTTDFSPSFLNLDLAARVPVYKSIALTLYLENLADVQYEKSNRIYHPGLTYRVGVSATF